MNMRFTVSIRCQMRAGVDFKESIRHNHPRNIPIVQHFYQQLSLSSHHLVRTEKNTRILLLSWQLYVVFFSQDCVSRMIRMKQKLPESTCSSEDYVRLWCLTMMSSPQRMNRHVAGFWLANAMLRTNKKECTYWNTICGLKSESCPMLYAMLCVWLFSCINGTHFEVVHKTVLRHYVTPISARGIEVRTDRES